MSSGKRQKSVQSGGRHDTEPQPEVLRIFEELIERGPVTLTLDSRVAGTIVPQKYLGDLCINLQFCHEFDIPDFHFDKYGVRASLLFSGEDLFCDVPWQSVYVMVGQGEDGIAVFPSHVPAEMRENLSEFVDGLDGHSVRIDSLGEPPEALQRILQ